MSSTLSPNIATLFTSSANTTSSSIVSILEASYGGATSGTVTSSQNPIIALRIAQQNETKDIQAEAKSPQVQRDIAAFTKAVNSAKTAKQLLQNPTVLKVLLTANGLGSQVGFPALAQKALLSNPSDPNGLANQLSSTNSQWLSTAQIYQFATKGLSIIQKPSSIITLTNAYAEVLWRQSLDKQTPGLSNALYFIQNAQKFTNATQILGDSVMRSVVTTALGVPQQIAFQPLLAQEQAITSRLDVSKFQNKQFVQSFADRFLAVTQASNMNAYGSSSSLVGLAAQASPNYA
jgi:hypothetical protein